MAAIILGFVRQILKIFIEPFLRLSSSVARPQRHLAARPLTETLKLTAGRLRDSAHRGGAPGQPKPSGYDWLVLRQRQAWSDTAPEQSSRRRDRARSATLQVGNGAKVSRPGQPRPGGFGGHGWSAAGPGNRLAVQGGCSQDAGTAPGERNEPIQSVPSAGIDLLLGGFAGSLSRRRSAYRGTAAHR